MSDGPTTKLKTGPSYNVPENIQLTDKNDTSLLEQKIRSQFMRMLGFNSKQNSETLVTIKLSHGLHCKISDKSNR